ncbi:hypothetical protein J6590_016268 [Homalodisca vitripennis]|uniref:Uncharacterized protein n=1 Tax=Homalodisca liturata TaxID=320908 RepID=A0A1B6IBV3_9HEMI|nr:hypothetical protein J6590_016268 [Homalodisca vitripennis]
MYGSFVGLIVLCLISSYHCHSMVAEYKHLDKKVINILFRPASEEDWDKMLKTVEYYIMKLMNHGLRISQQMETDRLMVKKILNNGRPKFMNFTLNEKELVEEIFIPEEKIQTFYNLCQELERTWVEFVKIVKAVKWPKKTKKPYILQGAFHGRRLGRRKGRKNPYPLQDNKKKEETIELCETKESTSFEE